MIIIIIIIIIILVSSPNKRQSNYMLIVITGNINSQLPKSLLRNTHLPALQSLDKTAVNGTCRGVVMRTNGIVCLYTQNIV